MYRRQFLQHSTALGALALTALPGTTSLSQDNAVKRVAGIVTIYRRNSHADVLLGKILEGWKQGGGPGPRLQLVSLYVDQFPADDMSVKLADKFGFRLCKTIGEAVTLGTDQVAVDGVISVGEHGDYPHNDKGQHLYPRKRFFSEILQTFEKCSRVVPVFNDKHPGPELADALWMAEEAKRLNVPWMAGSSLPVGYRDPAVTVPMGAELEASVAVGYSGLDVYGFHTLDVMQSLLERRATRTEAATIAAPRERGVRRVQCLPLSDLPKLIESGVVRTDVLDAALASSSTNREALASASKEDSAIFVIEYRDGLVAPVIMTGTVGQAISMAFKVKGAAIQATRAEERVEPRYPHFALLLKAIEQMMLTGKPAYPVERTLLSAGMLDRLLTSRQAGYSRLETPELAIEYTPVDYPFGM